ncbi:MAG: sigma-70 family RNA polymerase sigma factor [Chloroflexi bacterium]|nr:sigma-70 family RNA polymerase sigma factor [Chloroflexota bacterium]
MAVATTVVSADEARLTTHDFDSFFRQHYSRVYGLLYRVTGSPQDAEDASQELFLKLSRREAMWDNPAAGAWLWKAAGHAALNALRGERRRTAREERATRADSPVRLVSEREEDPAGAALRQEAQAEVRQALDRLDPRDRMLLLARHSGLSYAEVAQALNMNPNSVGTVLARAERRFKELYIKSQEPQV